MTMSIPNKILTVVFFFLLILPSVGDCQPAGSEKAKDAKTQIPTDRYGDPLPEGAIGRLGTMRFRHGFFTNAVAFSPDGKYLASGGSEPGRLWNATTGVLLNRVAFSRTTSPASLAFSPDSRMILASGGSPALFDVLSGKELGRFASADEQHLVAFSPDGKMVATERNQIVILWDVVTRKRIRQLQGHTGAVTCLAFSRKGEILATGSQDK